MKNQIKLKITCPAMENADIEKLVKAAVFADPELGATSVTIDRTEVNDAEVPHAPTQETLKRDRTYSGRAKNRRNSR